MNDELISRTAVVASILWAVVALLILAAWGAFAAHGFGPCPGAMMLGLSGCALSAAAATLHIKTYALRACNLIRATRDNGERAAPLYSLR